MELDHQSELPQELFEEKQRPEMLKVLCILSFVACGLLILSYGFGTLLLALKDTQIDEILSKEGAWDKIVESNPALVDADPHYFLHEAGLVCLYRLFATIFSLVGVIMMWRLEKIGFFVYALAELSLCLFTFKIMPEQKNSTAELIFSVLIDLVFIVLYMVNLKHMNKKNNNTFVQTGV